MEFLTTTYEMVANYFMMIKVTDVIDMAIIAFVVYNILIRMRSTTSVRILQGVLVLLIIMWLSTIFDLRWHQFPAGPCGPMGCSGADHPVSAGAAAGFGKDRQQHRAQADVYPGGSVAWPSSRPLRKRVTPVPKCLRAALVYCMCLERENQH